MANPKGILVLTTSSVEGLKIKSYLKPVSAHIVAGTNVFSDFSGALTDVFGGRSTSYQKQLSSLYNEAIEQLKYNAHEIGANCIIGLSIDMDEISGKGKSMFMVNAVGTAVIIEKEERSISSLNTVDKFENVGVERINNLRRRKDVINSAEARLEKYDDETWSFITSNQINEVFPFILLHHAYLIENPNLEKARLEIFNAKFISYIDALEESEKLNLLYNKIEEENSQKVALYLVNVIRELNLFDFEKNMILLKATDFNKQKCALSIATYDKLFYDKKDIENLHVMKLFIISNFKARGAITTKKQVLSSKEKEVWMCECSKTNDIGGYCGKCDKDIFGFKQEEMNPNQVVNYIDQKIELIEKFIQ
jgi:uncharacterized protein YbjQ (UPF0145 family)